MFDLAGGRRRRLCRWNALERADRARCDDDDGVLEAVAPYRRLRPVSKSTDAVAGLRGHVPGRFARINDLSCVNHGVCCSTTTTTLLGIAYADHTLHEWLS